jgi:hypothetical protein
MKVTTNIRAYITAEVDKIFAAKVNPYGEQAELDQKMIAEFCDELRVAKHDMIDRFIEENELVDTWRYGGGKYEFKMSNISFSHAATPTMIKAREWEKNNAECKVYKTREIIAKLELGANRQELDAMLAELLMEE